MYSVASKLYRGGVKVARELSNVSSTTTMKAPATVAAAMPKFESWRRHESTTPTIMPKNDALKQQLLTWGEYCAEVCSWVMRRWLFWHEIYQTEAEKKPFLLNFICILCRCCRNTSRKFRFNLTTSSNFSFIPKASCRSSRFSKNIQTASLRGMVLNIGEKFV